MDMDQHEVLQVECVIVKYKAQFLKQGPANKKEGPDPNKGSNQQ